MYTSFVNVVRISTLVEDNGVFAGLHKVIVVHWKISYIVNTMWNKINTIAIYYSLIKLLYMTHD